MNRTDAQIIADNAARVREQIATAADSVGRSDDEILLVAVTKYLPTERIADVIEAGLDTLGESRPQQLWDKYDRFEQADIRWHMIGHLQKNKIRKTLPRISLLESVDSSSMLDAVQRIAAEESLQQDVLIEVNISGDETKYGFPPDEVEASILHAAESCPNIAIKGLMGMAAREGGLDIARRNFESLRELRDRLIDVVPSNVDLGHLSMGMSRDFEEAVRSGATMVRIGRALYEGVRI